MSVLIKGMKIPDSCKQCDMFHLIEDVNVFRCGTNNKFYEADFDYYNIRHPDCPIVEVPTPHGRLIDADELLESFREALNEDRCFVNFFALVDDSPTIIEAEVSE